jgi:uncharacterized membrane protein YtjA (UPF0391 family)
MYSTSLQYCQGEKTVLNRTSYFLILAVLTGILGAVDILGTASPMARIFCVLFLAFFAISYLLEKRPPVT